MIQDGLVILEAHNDTFWKWEFDSDLLNGITIAVLATLLSYQLTAACHNIHLGSNPEGLASACEIHQFMLIQSSSPLEIISAVARLDGFDRVRFRGELPGNVRIARRDTKVKRGVVINLMILLLAAPMFNLVSVFITLYRDEKVTFSRAKNGVIALGVKDVDVSLEPCTSFCHRIHLRVVGQATSAVQFHLCLDSESGPDKITEASKQIRLIAESTAQGQIKVSVVSVPRNIRFSTTFLVDLGSDGKLFRTQPVFGLQDAVRLIHDGQDSLAVNCSAAKIQNSPQNESLLKVEEEKGLLKASKDFNCSFDKVGQFQGVIINMSRRVNIIDHDNISLVNVEDISLEAKSAPKYFNAGRMPFLIQRGRNVHLLPLMLITFLCVTLRIVTDSVFNNDVDEGIRAVVRYRLGIGSESSMLASSRTVPYNRKSQDGLKAHYGLPRPPCKEVKQFENRCEIGIEK